MTTESARWELPEPVEPPSADGLRAIFARVNRVTGMAPAGWVAVAAGALGVLAGVALGWVELVVAGAVALIVVALSLPFTLGRARLAVWLQLSSHSVVVGERAEGRILVRNQGERRHWGSRLDLPVGEDIASFALPRLASGEVAAKTFLIPTARRGRVTVGPARSVHGDPFGLTGREAQWSEELELYVHPRTIALPGREAGVVHDLEGNESQDLTAADLSFHALRPYEAGDDRRHVHWRSSARAGQLMVRQFVESRMSRVAVALDTGRAAHLHAAEFELAVSCAASLVVRTLGVGSPLEVLTSTSRLPARTRWRALDHLSLVEQTARGGVDDLVHGVLRRAPRASLVFCVTGSTASLRDLLRAANLFGADTRVIGLRVDSGAWPRAWSAGNVTVLQVGALEQLPRALRKALA